MKILIEYPIHTSVYLTIHRDELPENPGDLLDSVTKEELCTAAMDVNEISWDHIKHAWRESDLDNVNIFDEDFGDLYET